MEIDGDKIEDGAASVFNIIVIGLQQTNPSDKVRERHKASQMQPHKTGLCG